MSSCNYPTAGFTNVHECHNQGWDQLDGLCMGHYRETILAPCLARVIEMENLYTSLTDKLFNVEVAQGLRAQPARYQFEHKQVKIDVRSPRHGSVTEGTEEWI